MSLTGAPVVSVCVTAFRHVDYIADCIESVLAQRAAPPIEILVGDDASGDGTAAVVERLARRSSAVSPHPRAVNLGPADNVRALVRAARGEYIAHLDGDDLWRPDKLARQLDCLRQRPECVAVFANAGVIDGHGARLGRFNRGVAATVSPERLIADGNFLNHSSLLYRAGARDAVLQTSGPMLDVQWYLRLGATGGLAYLDEELVDYRWRTPGSAIAVHARAIQQGHLDAFLEAARLGMNVEAIRRGVGTYWGRLLLSSLAQRRFADARHWYGRLLGEQALGVRRGDLLRGALRAVPSALRSYRRRRQVDDRVFFPTP